MDVVGSEIGQKMRSAIKAKLTELGCYVDDELPDYVMVMVANKRTRAQMEDDLQLFLGDNTELFVNWLHQVLKKLQEVTVAAPLKTAEREKSKERSESKDRKPKEKKSKDKLKKSDLKKAKKKDKEKGFRKKEDKKNKKKSKHHEMIRPNIPPLLMNMEKDSEPSITDVFAGQILKNHGINMDGPESKDETQPEKKPVINEVKRRILPIIDPATISSQLDREIDEAVEEPTKTKVSPLNDPKEDQIKEMTQIEAKIQGLKQKLAEQLDSMSDDEDFLNIRTEAEELMNDFAEDVFQEISQQAPPVTVTPPLVTQKSPTPPPPPIPIPVEVPIEPSKDSIETLPQIELQLPKRPVRDRLGARDEPKKVSEVKEKEAKMRTESPERFTPDRDPDFWPQTRSAKSRLSKPLETLRRSVSDDSEAEKLESSSKKLTSRVSVLENRPSRATCASVVRVRPRPRVSTPASSLLLRAVADAHKSLLNAPPKVDPDSQQVKRALVLPMRRCIDAQKIVIQVPADSSQTETGDSISLGDNDSDDDKSSKIASDVDRDEYVPASITKKIINNEYTPSRRNEGRTASKKDDTLIIETINIHNPSIDKDKNTQFIVTMDGYHPNAFLAKKLLTEGLLNEDDDISTLEKDKPKPKPESKELSPKEKVTEKVPESSQKKRLSNTSEESDTQVIIKKEDEKIEKRKVTEVVKEEIPPVKKRRASPIVFDVDKKEKEPERVRERTESASSDQHVTVATVTNSHKYDSVPPLSAAERKLVWCRAFPLCRYGQACAFAHPRCKFLAGCTRRGCVYSHAPNAPNAPPGLVQPVALSVPSVASHVVPAANYKSISTVVANMCRFYPNCVNPACHYYHPKPCRYGKGCANKLECNFYHADVPNKWTYPV